MKEILFLANLGFSVIIPLLVSIYVAVFIKNWLGLPNYVVIIGVFFGIFSGIYSFCKLALNMKGQGKK